MKNSFHIWLESRDPDLFTLLEAEWRDRDSRKRSRWTNRLGMAAGGALGLAGLLGYGMSGDKEVPKPQAPIVKSVDTPKMTAKPVAAKELEEYTGPDAHKIFVYACDESNINTKFMPYIEAGEQKGWIAKVLLPASDTAPLTKDVFDHQYETLVRLARQEKPGVEWKWVAKAKPHPYKGYEKMRVIVLYAPVKVGER